MTIETSTSPSAADRDQLAVLHAPLVAHLVRETMARVPSSTDPHDLHSAALLALLAAARDFDPTRAVPFADHASLRIRGALVDELRSVDWELRAACPRDPSAARARLDEVLERFSDAGATAAALGLDRPRAERVAPIVHTFRGDADPHETADRRQYVEVALEELPQRLRHVVRGYFIEQRPMTELALEIGTSEARAVELRTEGLTLLRDALAVVHRNVAELEDQGVRDADSRRRLAYTRAVAVQYAARRAVGPRERLETSA